MMNFLAICLVVSSLAAAGVWSPAPSPENLKKKEEVIVIEGHQYVVVEYDQVSKHNPKESDSSSEQYEHHHQIPKSASSASNIEERISSDANEALSSPKHRIKEASSVFPNLGQGLSGSKFYDEGQSQGQGQGPRELICDGYGKCKHKVASALEKAKDSLSRAAQEVTGQKKRVANEAKDAVSDIANEVFDEAHEAKDAIQDVYGKAKNIASEKAVGAKEALQDACDKAEGCASETAVGAKKAIQDAYDKAKDTASEKASGAKEAVQDAYGKVKETASEKAHEATEAAKDALGKAKEIASEKAYQVKESVKDAKDIAKTIMEDIGGNASAELKEVENLGETIVEKAKSAKEGTVKKLGQYFSGFLRFVGFPQTLNSLLGVINLLGFSSAYGMSMWVTFISSHVLAGAMPRQQFGILQSKTYPVYFRAMALTIVLASVGHTPWLLESKAGMFQGFNLLASLLMVFINAIYLEPLATKVMFERMKIEKEEGRGREGQIGDTCREPEEQRATTTEPPAAEGSARVAAEGPEQEEARAKMVRLSERLKRLNTYSSVLNTVTLMCLTWHLVYLAQCLHTTC